MQSTRFRLPKHSALHWAALVLVAAWVGCNKPQAPDKPVGEQKTTESADSGPIKMKVAYLGLTCEAPIFMAYENDYFKDEGLDVELVKTDWDGLREGLGLGRFDANHTLVMYLLKPIEQGMDVKITGGIHTGCLRVQAAAKSDIMTVQDLRGKKIGVPTHIGSPPFLFASRALAANGLDPKKDVEFVALQPDAMSVAISSGQVDAVATSEPMGSIFVSKDLVRTIVDQATDDPYKDEYCCATVVSGKLLKRDPQAAAKVTRALLKGAKWVGENTLAAAERCVDKKYIAASKEINAQALSKLRYVPGVDQCRASVDQAAKEMKLAGLLDSKTDPVELAKKAWIDLDGVNDNWVRQLEVERVAGGSNVPRLDNAQFAALFDDKRECCSCCCLK